MTRTINGIEVLRCDACGKDENIALIDAKDDGIGDFTRFECIACYGPDWEPMAMVYLSQSIRPDLRPLYDAYVAAAAEARCWAAHIEQEG